MKLQHLILTAVLATGVSTSVHSQDADTGNYTQPNMPMMQGPMGYPQGQPMNPMMMERMQRMRERHMQMMDAPDNMPMGNMMRHHQQRMKDTAKEVSKSADSYNCPMHGKGKGNKSEYMKMKKQKWAAKQAHMKKVETRLANIEALLQKIVDSQ